MKKLTVVVVAAMILLAGCSGGGGGAASPTEESTEESTNATATGTPADGTPSNDSMEGTPMESTPMEPATPEPETATPEPDDDDDSDEASDDDSSTDPTPLSAAASGDPLATATVVNGTTYNGTIGKPTAVVRNDTSNNRELIEFTDESGTTSEVYTTEDYVAARNGSTGQVEYGGPDSFVGSGISLQAGFTAIGPLFYVRIVEWDQTSTTTVDGEDALVYESDSLNETALEENQNLNFNFDRSEVTSVDGEAVLTSEGQVQSITIEIGTQDGTYGGEMSLEYDDINVTKPSWVDESQAP